MPIPLQLEDHPLADFFLRGYLSTGDDPKNFPSDGFPDVLGRYERTFSVALDILGVAREVLRGRAEFKFDSGDAANLESGIAILRVVEFFHLARFRDISLVRPSKYTPSADLICTQNGARICCEVKAVTKQSKGRPGYLENQLYDKVSECVPKARKQLKATAAEFRCDVKVLVCVVNWLTHSLCLYQNDYLRIFRRLKCEQQLDGIDGVLFVTKMGVPYWFPDDPKKCLDMLVGVTNI
jgi:hypothetical protein